MAQRIEPDDSLDDFPTPPWGTRALLRHGIADVIRPYHRFYDPACNRGYMVRPLREFSTSVYATDVFDYGWDGMDAQEDFLFPGLRPPHGIDWVITNPPFRLAAQFIEVSLSLVEVGCAFLVRSAFLEGQDRYTGLYSVRPPTRIFQFSERIVLTKGIVRDPAKPYWDEKDGKWRRPSTATSYLWLVWVRGECRRPLEWIPPCRLDLERPGDYPDSGACGQSAR